MPPVKKIADNNVLVPTDKFPKEVAHFPFEKFNPVQSRIFDVYDKDANCVIAAATSAGKAQPDNTLVLTPHGFCPLYKIKIGDEVIGSNGSPTIVTGVFPQSPGKRVYRVFFNDGTSTCCCYEHLWAVRSRNDKKRGNPYAVMPTTWLIANFKPKKWHTPIVAPVVFSQSTLLPIHPYVLGLLLGDGGLGYGAKVTTSDEFCLTKLADLMPKGLTINQCGRYDYNIVSLDNDQYNELTWELRQMGLLGKQSHEKFIPSIYKTGSIENRWALLNGLMDSDGGGYSNRSPTLEVSSKQLAEDVAYLIRSLGGWTRVRTKANSTYKYKGELRQGRSVYRLTVVTPQCPFSLPRKSDLWHPRRRDKLRSIIDIQSEGSPPCRCISVAAEDGLYVTENFIVTHNTVCAEMFMSHEIRRRGGKAMYLAPLRALAKEKIDDWTDADHHFGDLRLSICTGDYRLTPDRKRELEKSNIIIMTSEMLNARARNFKAEQNEFLRDVKTLIVDESHLLTVPKRGDHLEVGLMKYSQLVPDARIVLLSATMPNVAAISEWVSYYLTGKDTYLLESTYRPCPLSVHYRPYPQMREYEENEEAKIEEALELVRQFNTDKFLIFVHTKRTGNAMKLALKQMGVEAEFHNADLEKDDRHALEKRFKSDKNMRVVVATSTLAWGLNLPARRVIITGVHRGLDIVENYDIWQMVGRAGRPGFDPRGDAYILVPDREADLFIRKIKTPQNIESKLLDNVGDEEKPRYKTLAFHLVSEIHHREVKTKEDIHSWYSKSLARFQTDELDDDVIDNTVEMLMKSGAIKEEEGEYVATMVGTISSMFYYSPFDVADLRRNFKLVFEHGYDTNDMIVSMMLGNVDSQRFGVVNKIEREEMSQYAAKIRLMFGDRSESAIKAGYAYYCLMNGHNLGAFAGIGRGLQFDFPRAVAVLAAIDTMNTKWGRVDWFRRLQSRMIYGVKQDLVDLVQIPNIGKVRAEKLWAAGIKTIDDVAANPDKVQRVLNMKADTIAKICGDAKAITLTSD